ncbi:hypothetical protein LCGC14_2761730 [marine sediment metagenome]|uniref:Uncharacterized protein n=1 Tax=marine sediment metagenome TaxID=412755 RepID=A0A0F9B7C6_9ZZZZ
MKTVDISGMGGSYELGCQKMIKNGMRFLKDKPDFDWAGYIQYSNIYGIASAESEQAKALDDVLTDGLNGDYTGAMHQAVVNHLRHIQELGYDGWLKEAEKHDMKIYEIPEEDEIDTQLLIYQIEWQLKLDGGYDPMAELFRNIPVEDLIAVDVNDPDSVKRAGEEILKRMRSFEGRDKNDSPNKKR